LNNSRPKKVVEAYYFGSPPCIAEKILFVKPGTRLAEYKAYLADSCEFGNVWRGVTGTLRGEKVSVIATGVGPAMVGDAVYALDKPDALCLYSGTCGGLDEALDIGDYFLAEQAVCADGYSLLLGRAAFAMVRSDEKALSGLEAAFRSAAKPFAKGITFTTGSVVRESDADFWDLVGPECQAIEMGCASFYAAALSSNKRPAAYFWVTDLPIRGKSFFDGLGADDMATKRRVYDAMVSVDISILASA
jgi:nucleoside phosphorylase